MGRKTKSDEQCAAAALDAHREAKAMEMRIRRRAASLYGVNPPKHKHKKVISIDRIVKIASPKRTRNADGVLVAKRGPKPKTITEHAVKKHLPTKLRVNFVESKSAYLQSLPVSCRSAVPKTTMMKGATTSASTRRATLAVASRRRRLISSGPASSSCRMAPVATGRILW